MNTFANKYVYHCDLLFILGFRRMYADLARGSCIADYRWNSGSEYHGLKWDEHLPTDSAVCK